jgi:hypothetical protein
MSKEALLAYPDDGGLNQILAEMNETPLALCFLLVRY